MRCPTREQIIVINASFGPTCGTGRTPATLSQLTMQLATAAPMTAAALVPTQQVNLSIQAAPVVVRAGQFTGLGCLVRGLYFLFVGLWLSQVWILATWFLKATVIGLPFGLMMLNRLPQVVTLKSVKNQTHGVVQHGAVIISQCGCTQQPFALRALYFAIVGWWASLFWAEIAWLLSISLLGLSIAFWMLDRTPAVTTLARR